jgi:hypothetical protein
MYWKRDDRWDKEPDEEKLWAFLAYLRRVRNETDPNYRQVRPPDTQGTGVSGEGYGTLL